MSGNPSASTSKEQDNDNVDEKENAGHILEYECSTYNHHIITGLSQLRDDILLCDVVLVAKGTRINAHRLILAAFSDYFRDMLNNEADESGLQEIEIVDMDASTLDALVTFCYTGRIKISESNVRSLLPAACLLQMNEVKIYLPNLLNDFLNGIMKKISATVVVGTHSQNVEGLVPYRSY